MLSRQAVDGKSLAFKVIRDAYNQPREMEVKTKTSDVDLVTETDKKVEEMLFRGLSQDLPGHK